MKNIVKGGVFTLVLAVSALADTITSTSPAWVLLPNSIATNTGTWGISATVPGNCGFENEPTCEPFGDFLVSSPFTAAPGYYTMTSSDGTMSDIITFGNTGPGGIGEIRFFSDPDLSVTPSGTNLGVICTEGVNTGCIGTFMLTTATGAVLTINPASDDEAAFDPFGFGFDSSDQIKFTGVTPISTPEPSAVVPLVGFLSAMGYAVRRRFTRD
jgi:hypothetical protein